MEYNDFIRIGTTDDPRTLQQRVFERLRRDIMLGIIEPGQSLTIRGLAEQLHVSAMPVREALRRLVAERAVELQDNRRVRIPPMTLERFNDLIAARVLLESEAAERAMPYVTDELIDTMQSLDDAVTAAQRDRNYDVWIGHNFAFHACLYNATPNSAFLPLIESLWLQIGPFLRRAIASSATHYTIDRHVEALAALRQRNTMALRIAIEADIRDGISHIGNNLIRAEADQVAKASRGRKGRARRDAIATGVGT